MTSNGFNPEELTEELNLWAVARKSFKIPFSNFNKAVSALVASCLLGYVIFTPEQTPAIYGKLRYLADLGFTFTIQILGFLVAGFTIIATITRKELFIMMAQVPYPESKFSYLKYTFFLFMRVFILYIGFCALCLFIRVFGQPQGPATVLFHYLPANFVIVKNLAAQVLFVLVGAWLFISVLALQSFVFNVYHMVMTAIRWEFEPVPTEENEDSVQHSPIDSDPRVT